MQKIKGKNVGFETSLNLTESDKEAIDILDNECSGAASGHWWTVVRRGSSLVAHPNGPFNSVKYLASERRWDDC